MHPVIRDSSKIIRKVYLHYRVSHKSYVFILVSDLQVQVQYIPRYLCKKKRAEYESSTLHTDDEPLTAMDATAEVTDATVDDGAATGAATGAVTGFAACT